MALVELDPDVAVEEHSHPNEQLGFVLQGSITMTVAGEARALGTGETYAIPADVRHSARAAAQGCSVIDIFAPSRADWEGVERSEPSPTRWPG
jgi:quercetin dioxygenase-like cupin family protein